MKGVIYRTAVRIKELGERIHCPAVIRFGLWIREGISNV